MDHDFPTVAINATQIVSYEIIVAGRIEEAAGVLVDRLAGGRESLEKALVFVDAGLPQEHVEKFQSLLAASGLGCDFVEVPGDEENKVLKEVIAVVEIMNRYGIKRRSSPCIVLGGGVSLDIVGLAASLYRRGVPFIRVPTTLLAMVDVGVAAKTAANHLGFRNRIGTFHPASSTIVCSEFLTTLPRRQMVNGVGEIFKLACIKDSVLFSLLEETGEKFVNLLGQDVVGGQQIIDRALRGMAEELEPNLWEANLKRVVDYGHTFGPAVEMRYIADLLHGEAVALDCLLSAVISNNRGRLPDGDLARVFMLAARLGLPLFHEGFDDIELLLSGLHDMTIHRDGNQNLPLMSGIGSAYFVNDLEPHEVRQASNRMKEVAELTAKRDLTHNHNEIIAEKVDRRD